MRCTFVIADPKTPHDFKGIEALDDADLLVLSVRRRAPTAEQMSMIRKYIESGKPLVGIRTAHAMPSTPAARRPRGTPSGGRSTPTSWAAITPGITPTSSSPRSPSAKGAESHPILAGVQTPFTGQGSLYKTSPLAASARALLHGRDPPASPRPSPWPG